MSFNNVRASFTFVKRLMFCQMALIFCSSIYCQTKRAFLIGISEYPHKSEERWGIIHGANDIDILTGTLKKQGFKITKLTNRSATASNIRKGLNSFISSCKAGDMVYLHFSCHGQPVEDLDGDEADGWDESIIPYDALKKPIPGKYEGKNHILDDELNVFFGKIRQKVGVSGFVCVVIDACHSGGMDRGDEVFLRGTDSGFSLSNKRYVPRMDTRSNIPVKPVKGWSDVCMLEACRAYQSNYEIKQNGTFYGPLSFYINQVLQQHQLSSDIDWTEKVKKQMADNPRLAKQNMVIQTEECCCCLVPS